MNSITSIKNYIWDSTEPKLANYDYLDGKQAEFEKMAKQDLLFKRIKAVMAAALLVIEAKPLITTHLFYASLVSMGALTPVGLGLATGLIILIDGLALLAIKSLFYTNYYSDKTLKKVDDFIGKCKRDKSKADAFYLHKLVKLEIISGSTFVKNS